MNVKFRFTSTGLEHAMEVFDLTQILVEGSGSSYMPPWRDKGS